MPGKKYILPCVRDKAKVKCYNLVRNIVEKVTRLGKIARRKKCPYSELFWFAFFPHFPAFGLNTERYGVFLRIQFECRKM